MNIPAAQVEGLVKEIQRLRDAAEKQKALTSMAIEQARELQIQFWKAKMELNWWKKDGDQNKYVGGEDDGPIEYNSYNENF